MTDDPAETRQPADHSTVEMVPIFETLDGTELMAAQGALESAGIPFALDDPGATPGASFGGSFDPTGEPTRILVPVARREEAEQVLTET